MGYTRKQRTFVLEFDDEEYEGLEIEMKSLPLGDFIKVSKLMDEEGKSDGQVEDMIKMFQKSIIRWNMQEEDGTPIPVTHEGLMTCDLSFILAAINGWVQGISSVSKSLGKDSNSGGTSPMPQLPMEAL